MTAESKFWSSRVKPALDKAGYHPRRIENSASAGLPDVLIPIPGEGYCFAELKIATGHHRFSLKKYQYAYFMVSASRGLGHLNYLIVKTVYPEVPVVIMSATTFVESHEVIRTNGNDVFVKINPLTEVMDMDTFIKALPNLCTNNMSNSTVRFK